MACFLSPVAYVVMVLFLMVSGGTFLLAVMKNEGSNEPLPSLLFGSIILWLTVLITVVSMRLFTEEKRSGTLETLMTAPVTEKEVVLGKYVGALTFLMIVTVPTAGYVYLLKHMSPGITFVDTGAMLGGYLILFLITALCAAIGLFASLMTRNQIVAAITCFCAIWVVLLFGWLVSYVPLGLGKFAELASADNHIADFARGSVDTRPIVMYVTGVIFMLFASVRVLEARRWR
jgi:ABC-2 type transport system permease protein